MSSIQKMLMPTSYCQPLVARQRRSIPVTSISSDQLHFLSTNSNVLQHHNPDFRDRLPNRSPDGHRHLFFTVLTVVHECLKTAPLELMRYLFVVFACPKVALFAMTYWNAVLYAHVTVTHYRSSVDKSTLLQVMSNRTKWRTYD